jgi:hypothetical protein
MAILIIIQLQKQPGVLHLKAMLLLWRLMGLFSVKKKARLEELSIDNDYTNLGPKQTQKSKSLSLWTEASGGLMYRQ